MNAHALNGTARDTGDALRWTEETLQLALDAGRTGVWEWDIVTGRITWSDRVHEFFGLRPGEFDGTLAMFARHLHPEDAERAHAAIRASVDHGVPYRIEYRIVQPGGDVRWIYTAGQVVRDAHGVPLRMIGATTDVTDRKRGEEALAREAKILASVHDAVVVTDPAGVVSYWNEGAERLFGWAAAEMVGRPYADRFAEPVRTWVVEQMRSRLEDGTEWSGEYEDYRKDGTRIWIDARVARFADSAGRPAGVLGVSRDITEKKRAEQSRRESDDRFRALVTATSDAVYRMSPDWTEMRHLVGREFIADTHEPSRSWLDEYIPPEDRPRVTAAIAAAVRTKGTFELEHRVVRVDGTPGWTFSRAIPIVDAAGEIVEWFGTASDVTRRKLAEAELARVTAESDQRKRLYETILSNTPDLAYVFDLDHRFAYANEVLLRMWGRTWDEAIGRTCLELGYEPWHAAMHDREIEQVKATKKPLRGEVPFTGTFGRRIYDYIFVPVLGADGEVEAVAGTTRDVTERKEAEEALRDADRKKDDFIALLAHELRNPLAPIRNGLQVMRLAGGDAAAVAGARAMMDRQLTHMVRLIDDLLDVSRIGRNKMDLRRARVLLADAIGSAVETARPLIDAAGHELILSLPAEPVFLDADLTRLAQVFSNLLTNSARYTGPGGTIRLTAERAAGGVVVTVRDNGIGIPAAALSTVFDMFSQVDRSVERNTGGLGIGLALVKGLVELHGGTVVAQSGGEGQGSTFTVTLPVVTDHEEPVAPVGDPGRRAGRRVLVADDNRDGAESLAMMLRLMGNEVATAHDGLDAVDKARAFRPDLVLMDIGMPRLSGLDATARIREEPWGTMTIIALTGWGQEADKERSRTAGCDGHLVKPVSLPDLEKMLAEPPGRRA